MEHFQQLYTSRAADHYRMIAAEDIDGILLAALWLPKLPQNQTQRDKVGGSQTLICGDMRHLPVVSR